MFAHNNEQIDYGLLAMCNAQMIREHHPEAGIALVTDEGTLAWLNTNKGEETVNRLFDHVIIGESPGEGSTRRFNDTLSTTRDLTWRNQTRRTAYEYSPFKETILLDVDFLIGNSSLAHCWGSSDDLRMNSRVLTLNHEKPHQNEQRLEPYGIPLYWATCVYFRKSTFAAMFFGMVAHVQNNYDYYQHIYRFPGALFRNDYAFSIAAHILSGSLEGQLAELPVPFLLTSFDCDELIDLNEKSMVFLVNDPVDRWKFTVSRISGQNVHVMNKFSIGRNADRVFDTYGNR